MRWLKCAGALLCIPLILGGCRGGQKASTSGPMIASTQSAAQPASRPPAELAAVMKDMQGAQNGAPIYEKAFAVVCTPAAKEGIDAAWSALRGDHAESAWQQVERVASTYRSVLPDVEKAAACSGVRFSQDWSKPPYEVAFPHYAKLRTLVRYLTLDAVSRAKSGDMAASMRSISLAYRTASVPVDDPFLIAQLASEACLNMASRGLHMSLDLGDPTEQQARSLSDEIGRIDLVAGWEKAMHGERHMGQSVFKVAREKGIDAALRESGGIDFRNPLTPSSMSEKDQLAKDEQFFNQEMDKAIKYARVPYRDGVKQHLYGPKSAPDYAVLSRGLVPTVWNTRQQVDTMMTTLAGDRIYLALVRHKAKYGSYPPSLKGLAAKLSWKLPEDVLTGKSFVYRREGNGFLLYSIGQNMRDDGAKTVDRSFVYGLPASSGMTAQPGMPSRPAPPRPPIPDMPGKDDAPGRLMPPPPMSMEQGKSGAPPMPPGMPPMPGMSNMGPATQSASKPPLWEVYVYRTDDGRFSADMIWRRKR